MVRLPTDTLSLHGQDPAIPSPDPLHASAVTQERARPSLTVVVVVYDMARELPRTLLSLDPDHQHGVDADDYEVVVVDNGSPIPVDRAVISESSGHVRMITIDDAPPSPVTAANHGIAAAEGELIGLFIDGARLASPGLMRGALRAQTLTPRPVITAPAFHLGSETHMKAAEVGYDQSVEDELLGASGWTSDGYRLFGISTLAGSSSRGIFGMKGESNSLFMPRSLWDEVGGMDPAFQLPGGGLANHDLYRRACSLEGIELIELLGEGSFHQFHGGAATSRRFGFEEMHDDYKRIRRTHYRPPALIPLHVGRAHEHVLDHLEYSAHLAIERRGRLAGRADTTGSVTTSPPRPQPG